MSLNRTSIVRHRRITYLLLTEFLEGGKENIWSSRWKKKSFLSINIWAVIFSNRSEESHLGPNATMNYWITCLPLLLLSSWLKLSLVNDKLITRHVWFYGFVFFCENPLTWQTESNKIWAPGEKGKWISRKIRLGYTLTSTVFIKKAAFHNRLI